MAKERKQVIAVLILLVCLVMALFNVNLETAFADDTGYTKVLEDLSEDTNFTTEDYPVNEDDHSLKVIQLAESTGGEIFLYVYQPSGNLTATEIRMSTTIGDNTSPKDYDLRLLNTEGVFSKYKIQGVRVKEDVVRYYDLISIFREFNKDIDDNPDNDNTISQVTFKVGQLWTVVTYNGETSYHMTDSKVIEVTGKYAGFMRYSNAVAFNNSWTDAHFVAFSTDYAIDTLLQAEVYYVETYFKYVEASLTKPGYTVTLSGPTDMTKVVKYDEVATMTPNHEWFPNKYTWKRIQSVEEFKTQENLKDVTTENLEGMQWVLRFAETPYEGSLNSTSMHTWYEVKDISILRLEFETEGEIYNLGVVDNKQSGDDIPDNIEKHWYDGIVAWFKNLGMVFKILVGIAIGLGGLFVLGIVIKILTIVWKIISFPFKGGKK